MTTLSKDLKHYSYAILGHMQLVARKNELRIFLALRPSNFLFGRWIRIFKNAVYVPGLGYIVNSAEFTRELLKDSEHFSLNEAGGLGTLIADLWGDTPTLLSMDGDEHTRIKFALLELFKEESLQDIIAPKLSGLVSSLIIKPLQAGQATDIARAIKTITSTATLELLGVGSLSKEDIEKIWRSVDAVMGCIDLRYPSFTPKNREIAVKHVAILKDFATKIYNHPDLTKGRIIDTLKSLGYTEEKTYGFIAMFLVAGSVTVSSTMPRLLSLLIDTDQLEPLKQKPELIKSAIDEGLRYITPGPVLLHAVKESTTIQGIHFKKGRRVMVLLYNVMHDKRYTKQPFTFDIQREQNKLINNLWFGVGAHFCMGSLLAKLEIETILKNLLSLNGELHITKRAYCKAGIYPGYSKLDVELSSKT